MMKKLTEAEKQVTEDTRELLVSLDEKHTKLTEHQTNVVNIEKYASELQTFLAVRQIEKDVETQDLKTIATSIQKFGEVVVESKPCDMIFVRTKDKQAQILVADISPHMPVENIQLKLNQKITIKRV